MASYCLIEAFHGSFREQLPAYFSGDFDWFKRGQLTSSTEKPQQLFKREWPMGKQNKLELCYHLFR